MKNQEIYYPNSEKTRLDELKKYLQKEVRQEIAALEKLVKGKFLTIDQISKIPLRNLREAAIRVVVRSDANEKAVLSYPYDLHTPCNRLEKFRTIVGLTPSELQAKLSIKDLEEQTNSAIIAYNEYAISYPTVQDAGPRANVVAVVYNGSYFEPGKTPSIFSDLDCVVVHTDNGLIDKDMFKIFILQRLLKIRPDLAPDMIDMAGVYINGYLSSMEREIKRVYEIARPYQQRSSLVAASSSSFVASPYLDNQTQILRGLVSKMPFNLSEYPSDHHRFPSREDWEKIKFTLTSKGIAESVRSNLSTKK